ncbi:uncharacterized protein LOC128298460 [Anopheles moucheti]|uniref:uncharacterized protein LOC128298460 n=1 Tax=Anopheles moucheti TaxID=186751 RepID=UPI0022F07FCD|nr:uncharacterized protein LOC128298460 [Anopheles moucheti]
MAQMPKKAKKMSVTMSHDSTTRFIAAVRELPVLWNVALNDYRNGMARERAWAKIAEEQGFTISEVKEKWKSLRSSYRHYTKVRKDSMSSGAGTSQKYRIDWMWYDEMVFLADTFDGGKTKNSLPKTRLKASERVDPSQDAMMMEEWLEDPVLDTAAPEVVLEEEVLEEEVLEEEVLEEEVVTEEEHQPGPSHQQSAVRSTRQNRREGNSRIDEECSEALQSLVEMNHAILDHLNRPEIHYVSSLREKLEQLSPRNRTAVKIKIDALVNEYLERELENQ